MSLDEKLDLITAPEAMGGVLATRLRSLTPARVGLKRAGLSLATDEVLDFQLAHARARDAVHAALQPGALMAELQGLPGIGAAPVLLRSAARDRQTFLQRPDLGRRLDEASRGRLQAAVDAARGQFEQYDLAIVLVDGLSALAVERHAVPLLRELMPILKAGEEPWRVAPVSIVEQGRVAIGDEIGAERGASLVIVLIGERPGLSSPDSLGAYVTWQPRVGRTDAERNCISNIRTEGLGYAQAAARLMYFLNSARALQLTGVGLTESDLELGQGSDD